ncbi:hypothetical protein HPB47_006640 [Ixodes persulcatus]|uniref:Uncharacterized protein n=1 Tax=Ixodes persulcatus TaxID=34615 RepID=A0AC60PAM4_IXOPE|nr:hypothetical protein HPB47_006640 [Ixodes persulcatus]
MNPVNDKSEYDKWVMKQSPKYKQRYRKEWEECPAFKGWLAPVAENACIAFCKNCKITFTAKLSDIRSHSNSRKHQRAMQGQLPRKRMSTVLRLQGIESLDVSNIVNLYREMARVPSPKQAHLTLATDQQVLSLDTVWDVRDVEQAQMASFTRRYVGQFDLGGHLSFQSIGHPQCCTGEESWIGLRATGRVAARARPNGDDSTLVIPLALTVGVPTTCGRPSAESPGPELLRRRVAASSGPGLSADGRPQVVGTPTVRAKGIASVESSPVGRARAATRPVARSPIQDSPTTRPSTQRAGPTLLSGAISLVRPKLETRGGVRESRVLSAVSHSGIYKAVLRKVHKKGEQKQFFEFWDQNMKLDSVDLEGVGAHGKVHENGTFSSFCWSNSENQVLYVAEKKQPKRGSYFSRNEKEEVERGTEFLYKDSWGEEHKGFCVPTLCTINVYSSSINIMDNLPDGISPGQAIWAPEDTGIVFVGWDGNPWKLGLAFCNNRRSQLYYYEFELDSYIAIGDTNKSIYSPRFSPDGSTLVYLQAEVGGPHFQSCQLVKCNWETKQTVIVVDRVNSPVGNEFPGLYLRSLPHNCFISDLSTVILSSCWHSKWEVIGVNTANGDLLKLSRDETVGYWQVLTVKENFIVASLSALNSTPHIVVGMLSPEGSVTVWTPLEQDDNKVSGISWYILQFSPPDESNMIFEATLVTPKNESDLPLIVWPHGK